jgi:hypothetical protein
MGQLRPESVHRGSLHVGVFISCIETGNAIVNVLELPKQVKRATTFRIRATVNLFNLSLFNSKELAEFEILEKNPSHAPILHIFLVQLIWDEKSYGTSNFGVIRMPVVTRRQSRAFFPVTQRFLVLHEVVPHLVKDVLSTQHV